LISSISSLHALYLQIKDAEFSGIPASLDLYSMFKEQLTNAEFASETISLKRNQILNNFETLSQPTFTRYFGKSGENIVFSNDRLNKIIQRSALRANDLKIKIKDMPRELITDEHIRQMIDSTVDNKPIAQEILILKSRKNPQTIEDQSMVLGNLVNSVRYYGVRDGLKKADMSLIPESYFTQQN